MSTSPGIKIVACLALLLLFSIKMQAQSCGFGCFGLGGFYVGFNAQQYKADGFNSLIERYNDRHSALLSSSLDNFERSTGFRLGANIFRTKYKKFLFSVKGYYQFLKEENSSKSIPSDGIDVAELDRNYSLNLSYWGVGGDLGYALFRFMDVKFIDAQLTIHSAKLTVQTSPAGYADELIYKSDKSSLGFSIGSGVILHLVGDYISLEATAAYLHFNIEELKDDKGNTIHLGPETDEPDIAQPRQDFINRGGFGASVQLNIGIPLY